MISFIRQNPGLSSILAALVILSTAAAFLPPAPVWITDTGNKYMVMRSFARTGRLALQPAVEGTFPTGGFHFVRTQEGYRSFYPELLPAASSFFYRLAGKYAVTCIPLLCGVLLAGAVAVRYRSFAAAMLVLFATPCWIYSLQLWEMIPAVLIGFLGMCLLQKKYFFSGGLVLALGLFMREELYFLGAAAGIVLLFQKQWRSLLNLSAGFLSGMLPVWLVQYLLTGHVFGIHGARYYLNNRSSFDLKSEISGVFWNYFHHLLRFEPVPCFFLVSLLIFGCGFFVKSKKMLQLKACLIVIAGILFLYGAWKFCGSSSLCYQAALASGLIAALPLGWGFWSSWRHFLVSGSRQSRFTSAVIVVYTLMVPPLLTRHDVGLFWGARHFLFIMPFLAYFSLRSFRELPGRKYLSGSIAALAVCWQLCGFYALDKVASESAHFTETVIANSRGVVASDVFFLPEFAPDLFFEREFCEVVTPEQFNALLRTLKARKIREFTFVTSLRWSRLKKETRQLLERTTYPANGITFKNTSSGLFDMVIIQLCLKESF